VKKIVMIFGLLILFLATANTHSSAETIIACVAPKSGNIRIAGGPGQCRANEVEYSLITYESLNALEQRVTALEEGVCFPTGPEMCDGIDNNCDGEIDNGLTPPLGNLQDGVCEGSVKICLGSDGWGEPEYPAIFGYQDPESNCSDSLDNDCDGLTDFDDPDCAPTPAPGDVIVTEIMIDPNCTAEWFELYNTASYPINLQGTVIKDNGTDSFTIDAPLIINPGSFLVFSSATTLSSIPVDYVYASGSFLLANTGDEVIVTLSNGTVISEVQYGPWSNAGISRELSQNHYTAAGAADSSNWCLGTTNFYCGDLGTPGSNNDCAK
jgi:hypothetical protein